MYIITQFILSNIITLLDIVCNLCIKSYTKDENTYICMYIRLTTISPLFAVMMRMARTVESQRSFIKISKKCKVLKLLIRRNYVLFLNI